MAFKSIETKLFSIKRVFNSLNNLFLVQMFSNDSKIIDRKSGDNKKKTFKSLPEPPDNCCQSGCDNCVWIQWAKDVEEYYRDGGLEAEKQIEKLINDPSLKHFIQLQIHKAIKDK